MKKILPTLCWAALLASLAAVNVAAQKEPTVTQSDGRTFLDSQITLGTDYPAIRNPTFLSIPVLQLKKGDMLPSRGLIGKFGMDRMLSLRQYDFSIGPRTVPYSVVALMRCSNFPDTGSFVKVIASTTVFKVEVKPGGALRASGLLIETSRAIKAGEKVPTVRIHFGDNYFIFSIEEAGGTGAAKPFLTIAPEHTSARDREVAMEAWRLSNESVREGIVKSTR
jgi:hypothetical protein